ncbi:MAG: Uma2 family endonuclease [Trichodesmium sp.]
MIISTLINQNISLEDFTKNPPEKMEWIDGKLIEKNGITLRHGKIQLKLGCYWDNYKNASQQGGEVYTNEPYRTNKQGRSPDVAYLTPELVSEYGNYPTLPQSFPLSAEIISPADLAENVFLKAQEYLESGDEEVWLVFPESKLIIIITKNQSLMFTYGQVVTTQKVLIGLSLAVDDLLA